MRARRTLAPPDAPLPPHFAGRFIVFEGADGANQVAEETLYLKEQAGFFPRTLTV